MQTIMRSWELLRRFGQELGPYLMLEILLPGGTLLALLLFLHRRRKLNIGSVAPGAALTVARALAPMAARNSSR
jgi:hypothetical protein